jgi:hypothetical protein
MKKVLITFIALIACLQFAKAQNYSATEFSAGVGFNGSSTSDINNNSTDAKLGFNAGVAIDQYFSRSWSLHVGANYQQKGWANGFISFDDGSEIDNVDYKLSYLTVPVLAAWHFGHTKNWYLNFGPYVGFLLDASENSNTLINTKSYFNNADAGLAIGIGVKLPLTQSTQLFIEYGEQGGVSNIFKNSDQSLHNSTSSFNIGICF